MKLNTDFLLARPFAHRGLHNLKTGRPENSRAAFEAAIEAGYGIEFDIQLSRDGHAIVFHDYDLQRLTVFGGPVRQHDADELGSFRLSGSSETIPTLAEVLKLVAGRTPLLIEVKDQDGALGPDTCGLEAAVARDLADYEGDVALMSFNPHSVGQFHDLLPNTPRGLVTDAFSKDDFGSVPASIRRRLRAIPDFESVGANFISHDIDDLGRARVHELRKNGTPILSWTIKSQAKADEALRYSDNITFEGFLPANLLP